MSFKELLNHPYLNYEQVKSIVNYIDQMGELKNAEELLQLEGMDVQSAEKIKPYVRFHKN